jgi:hypothetical protein
VQATRAVQVVLGEGEPGILRLVLEAQGFDVVGHARGDDELRRIVDVTRPSVIVLDAGISALAALDAQTRSDGVPIVVVWPKDVFTPLAEERVDPAGVILELGNAVRRVADRHAAPIVIPEADPRPGPERMADRAPAPPERRRRPGRARHALVLAAAWTIALTALAAIGFAVPIALRGLQPAGSTHPLLARPPRAAHTLDREAPPDGPADPRAGKGPGCGRPDHAGPGQAPSRGKPDDPGRACAPDQGHGAGGASGLDHGRPDDPGKSSGRANEEHGGGAQGGAASGKGSGESSAGGQGNGGDHQGGGGDSQGDGGQAGDGTGPGDPYDGTSKPGAAGRGNG